MEHADTKSLLIFENPGEIDPRLIATFGVNVKEMPGAIGFFGTGLKYALGVLVRLDQRVVVQSGERVFNFSRQPTEIRGKTFDLVAMDGNPLGFTTEVGKMWEPWMAYRELRCNATDEGGREYEATEEPAPTAGITRVIVEGPILLEAYRERNKYFVQGEPLCAGGGVEVYPGASDGIFYRGVRVASCPNPSLFTYNITTALSLTEDRTAKYSWELPGRVAAAMVVIDNIDVVRAALLAPKGTFENTISYATVPHVPTDMWKETVADLTRDRAVRVNASAVSLWQAHSLSKLTPDTVTLTKVERTVLDRALKFCTWIGFNIKYEIVIAESLGNGVLGLAADGRIYLAQRAFMMGAKTVAGTLIEEYLHLKHELSDCSREMQNYILDRLVSIGEELTGEPL